MTWKCQICESENPDDAELCEVCGAYREEKRYVTPLLAFIPNSSLFNWNP